MKKSMCIVVWHDMLNQIRNYKWFKTKTENSTPVSYWIMYIFCVMPTIGNIFKTKETAILYFSLVVALVMSLMLVTICPMRLPKIMYLCPMEAKERRQYLITSYASKVVLSVLISSLAEIIPLVLGYITWYAAAMVVFATAMLSMSINMAGGDRAFQASDEKDRALKKRNSNYPLWLIGQQIYAFFYFVAAFIGIGATGGKNAPLALLVFYLILSVINLFLTLKLLRLFPGMLEILMNYEMVYEVDRTRRSTS